jgi:hypothetical protein
MLGGIVGRCEMVARHGIIREGTLADSEVMAPARIAGIDIGATCVVSIEHIINVRIRGRGHGHQGIPILALGVLHDTRQEIGRREREGGDARGIQDVGIEATEHDRSNGKDGSDDDDGKHGMYPLLGVGWYDRKQC